MAQQQPYPVVTQKIAHQHEHLGGQGQLGAIGLRILRPPWARRRSARIETIAKHIDRQHDRIEHRPHDLLPHLLARLGIFSQSARAPHRGARTARPPISSRGRFRKHTREIAEPRGQRMTSTTLGAHAEYDALHARFFSLLGGLRATPPPAAGRHVPGSRAVVSGATDRAAETPRPPAKAATALPARLLRDNRLDRDGQLIAARATASRTWRAVSPSMTPLRERPAGSSAVYANLPSTVRSVALQSSRVTRRDLFDSWSRL